MLAALRRRRGDSGASARARLPIASSTRAANARSLATISTPAQAGWPSASIPRSSPSATPGSMNRCWNSPCDGAADWAREPPIMIAGPCRSHRSGGEGSADRARSRLSRRASLARRAQRRERGRTDRPCPGASRAKFRSSDFTCSPPWAGIVLPVSFWRRFAADRECRRDQDRAVQPLSHARCGARRGRSGRRRPRHALYRQ